MLSVAGEFLTKGSCRSRAAVKLIGRVRRPRVQPAANALADFRAEGGEIFAFEKAVVYSNTCARPRASTSEIIEGGGAGRAQAEMTPRSHDAAHFSGLAAVT
jgi:hypothetical protein